MNTQPVIVVSPDTLVASMTLLLAAWHWLANYQSCRLVLETVNLSHTPCKFNIPSVVILVGAERQPLANSWRKITRERAQIFLLLRLIFLHVAMLMRE